MKARIEVPEMALVRASPQSLAELREQLRDHHWWKSPKRFTRVIEFEGEPDVVRPQVTALMTFLYAHGAWA